FDFSHPDPVTTSQLRAVEAEVNDMIRRNDPVTTRVMAVDEAMDTGALALFGEKYGDEVRVVFMGHADDGRNGYYSIELCGGTHVRTLGDIALFKTTGENAVSSGIRRIEAVTGEAARLTYQSREDALFQAAAELKAAPGDVVERISALVAERKQLEKDLAAAKKALALGGGDAGPAAPEQLGDIQFFGQVLEDVPAKELRGIADAGKKRLGSGIVLIIGINEGKVGVVAGVTKDLTERQSAVDLVQIAAREVGGKGGGGRPDMAQAGGPNGADAQKALLAVKSHIAAAL
ncbi:MAG: DHHA1 domain-containing protein, partial [Pseudomonadota bacterium]